jgi:hypothetical protein
MYILTVLKFCITSACYKVLSMHIPVSPEYFQIILKAQIHICLAVFFCNVFTVHRWTNYLLNSINILFFSFKKSKQFYEVNYLPCASYSKTLGVLSLLCETPVVFMKFGGPQSIDSPKL